MPSHSRLCLLAASVCAFGTILAGCGGGPGGAISETSVPISSGLEFDCFETSVCNTEDLPSNKKVLMIHGFPEKKEFWAALMLELAEEGYCAVACDMHGYSPNASPDDKSRYRTDAIRADTFDIATQVGFDRFHLVTHDHGALLGWRMAGSENQDRILSFTSMAIPHYDAFSEALYGASKSVWQEAASQYFTMFVLENSSSLHGNYLFNAFRCSHNRCFDTPAEVQKILWWYNGVLDQDIAKMALPRVMTPEEILATDYVDRANAAALRGVFSGYTHSGWPQQERTGNISVPTLFICGNQDTSIMCYQEWAKSTEDYCTGGYTYLEVDCGHNLSACEEGPTEQIKTSILAHLASVSSVEAYV